jgi:hypothetical protein
MLNMAVFAICLTAPAGAIFIAQLGPLWLEKKKGGNDETAIGHEPIPRRVSQFGPADEILNFRRMYHDKDDLSESHGTKVRAVELSAKKEEARVDGDESARSMNN